MFGMEGEIKVNNLKEVLAGPVCALEPVYLEGRGDATRIHLSGGRTSEEEVNISRAFRLYCRLHNVSRTAVRQAYGSLLTRRNLLPVPVALSLVFIPLKMRRPLFKGDGAYGWVAVQCIDSIASRRSISVVSLKTNSVLKCLESKQNIQRKIKEARVIELVYRQQQLALSNSFKAVVVREIEQDFYDR